MYRSTHTIPVEGMQYLSISATMGNTFSKVLCKVTSYSKYDRALAFETVRRRIHVRRRI